MTFWRSILVGAFTSKPRTFRNIQTLRQEIQDLTGGQPLLWHQERLETFELFEIRCLTTKYIIWTAARSRRAEVLPLAMVDAVLEPGGDAISFRYRGDKKITARWDGVKNAPRFFQMLSRLPKNEGLEGVL